MAAPVLSFGLLWVAVATFLSLQRSTGVPPWDTLWQEDGGIFLTDALHHQVSTALWKPYNGYLHVVPRLLAALAVHLPLQDAGWVFAVSSALIVALVSAYVWWAARLILPSLWVRNLLAVLVVFVSTSAYETDNNINNLHWYLLFALAFVPFSAPRTRWGSAVNLVVVVAATLSDADAVLLVPLFVPYVVRALKARRPSALVTPAVLAACLIVQYTVGARGQSPGRYDASHLADIPPIYAFRVAGSFLIGDKYLPELYDDHGLAFAYLCLGILAVFVLGALVISRRLTLLATCVGGSCLFFGAPLALRGTGFFLDKPANLNGSRYALLPVLFLAVGLLGAVGARRPRLVEGDGRLRIVPAAVCLLAGAVMLYNFADFNVRTPGPSWRASLTSARQTCLRTHDTPREVGTSALGNAWGTPAGPHDVIIQVAPALTTINFAVVINCAQLRTLSR